MYISPHGKPEGLAERLEAFASQLGKNQGYPWLGLGIVNDLRCAVAIITGQPIPAVDDDAADQMEWDL